VDLAMLPEDMLREFVRSFVGLLRQPKRLPAWLGEDVLDFYVAEQGCSGLAGPLHRSADLDWQILGQYQDNPPVSSPALFIGDVRDVVTIWGQQAIALAKERVPDLRRSVIVPDCGHWIHQDQRDAVSKELLAFPGL
jgi:pimeloyl-ACP methyl ester carboxylesterase